MKIYFAGSIRGGRDDAHIHAQMIGYLKNFGQVLTEHLSNQNLTSLGESLPPSQIYERDMAWIEESDVVVADVSTPSLGVGYEIAKAEEFGKKILCLYRPQEGKSLSAMIAGGGSKTAIEYSDLEEAKIAIDKFLA